MWIRKCQNSSQRPSPAIGYLVRISDPSAEATKNTEPSVTRSQNKRRCQKHPQPESAESDPSDSESEFDEIPECQSFDIDEVERRVLSTFRQSNQIPKYLDENMDVRRSDGSDTNLPDGKSSDDAEPENTGNETETDVEPELTSSSKKTARSKDNLTRHSQRQSKPVTRLTYDKPGHSMDEPVTIVHHGMVIQLNLNPQATDGSTDRDSTPTRKAPLKNHTIR